MNNFDSTVEAYRLACKDAESIYSAFAKKCGLSDAEYWLMWMISEGGDTQSEISERLFISKQTVNSACRQLENKGLITLKVEKGNLRTKKIKLTEDGKNFVERYVESINRAEERVWNKLGERERALLVEISQKYNEFMKRELAALEDT